MKSKRWMIWVGIIVLIALSAPALILVNFSAMSSHMDQNSSMATSTGSTQPVPSITPDETLLVVTGDERLAQPLRDQVSRQLQGNAKFGQIQQLQGIVEKAGAPLLLIEIAPQEMLWTPIYARATLKITVSYSSDGDVSFRTTSPVEFKHTGGLVSIQRSGVYTFSDVSWGIISNPGYMNYLAREIARPIAANLAE